ncbi:MAG: hypothetical protein ACPGU1_05540 [Myxococcota bacterium]
MTPISIVLLTLLAGCGGDTTSNGVDGDPSSSGQDNDGEGTTLSLPSAIVVTQESMTIEAFEGEASEDAELAAVAAGLNLTSAGSTSDSDGAVVTWAEGEDSSGVVKAAVRHCMADVCVHAIQIATASGLDWQSADGTSMTPRTLGQPVLSKNLTGQTLDGQTVIAAQGLSSTNIDFVDPAAMPSYDYATRDFVALNTFGDAFGTTLSTVTTTAERSGGFDNVTELQYVREDTLQETFEGLDGMDAVVWLTQGVRQLTQGNQDEWRASRTVGYTTNRGGFGDHTLDRDAVKELLNFNLAGGPGLVVIAGSASYSDGSDDQPDSGSAWQKLNDRDRVVVGVKGLADAETILTAVEAFLDAYLTGDVSLEDALQLGSIPLAESNASLESNQFDVDLSKTWTASDASVWSSVPFYPNEAQIRIPIAAIPFCLSPDAAPGTPRQPRDEDQAQPFTDITFDGASFSGASETALTGVTVAVNVQGTVTGFTPGDRVFLEVWGDFDESFRGFHGFGEGTIQEVSEDDNGVLTVGFNGIAFATPYTNDLGESCILNGPKIQTTTSGLAAFVLTP